MPSRPSASAVPRCQSLPFAVSLQWQANHGSRRRPTMALELPSAPPAIVRLEVCVDSVRSTRAALAGGAHAVELCSGLVDGGITPSLGLIAAVVGVAAQSSSFAAPAVVAEVPLIAASASASVTPPGNNRRLRVNVLIRCRPGDFLYDDDELDVMLHDIRQCGASGADGVVVGALTADGAIDERALRRMIEAAGDMKVRLGLPRRRNPPRSSTNAASNSVSDFN